MYAPRLVASIVVRGGLHVQSIGFQYYLPVGSPAESAREFDRWGIDEIALILLDSDTQANRRLVTEVSAAIAVPLTAVGGIREIDDAKAYIAGGADKLGLNRSLVENPDLVRQASQIFGEQCVIASIDLVRNGKDMFRWDYWKKATSGVDSQSWVADVKQLGAGEIFLNFPQCDGKGQGMDLHAIQEVVSATTLPVVAAGGIGTTAHAVDCFQMAKPSGIGVGNRLAHFEQSVLLFKKALSEAGAPVRKGVKASYSSSPIGRCGRPGKRSEKYLEELLFQRIETEQI